VSLTLHSALKKLNTEHSIAYRCFPQASTFGQLTKTSCKSKSFGLVLYSAIKKLPVGDGDDLMPQILGHFICLFTLIINIYGLGEGISTIKKFTSGRGWGMTPRGLSYKVFNLPSHPDHEYIWLRGGDLNH
jgi:hypothetical protein